MKPAKISKINLARTDELFNHPADWYRLSLRYSKDTVAHDIGQPATITVTAKGVIYKTSTFVITNEERSLN